MVGAGLRRCVLAASLVHDLDVEAADDGLVVCEGPQVPWSRVESVVEGVDPESADGRARMAAWLTAVVAVGTRSSADLKTLARPVGLPRDHALHPGEAWVRESVLGGALDLGLGFAGIGADPDAVVILPRGVLDGLGHDASPWWAPARHYLDEMGQVAAARYALDPSKPLRPMGDCDVVTLLGSAVFRAALTRDRSLQAVAVPVRTRGWLDLSRVDPAFVVTAAHLAEPHERGFSRPLLITAEEVCLAREGEPVSQVLRDSATTVTQIQRPVRYR